jgi:hypothetical protein
MSFMKIYVVKRWQFFYRLYEMLIKIPFYFISWRTIIQIMLKVIFKFLLNDVILTAFSNNLILILLEELEFY